MKMLAGLNLRDDSFFAHKGTSSQPNTSGEKSDSKKAHQKRASEKMVLITRGETGRALFALSSGLAAGMGLVHADGMRECSEGIGTMEKEGSGGDSDCGRRSAIRNVNVVKAGVKVAERDSEGSWALTMAGAAVMRHAAHVTGMCLCMCVIEHLLH